MSFIKLFGGQFQDAVGNLLANGILTMQLTADAQSNSLDCQIVAGPNINIVLDSNANISNVNIESNATINPAGTGYLVSAYTNAGVLAWLKPQIWVLPNVNTDAGTIIPTTPSGPSYPNISAILALGNVNGAVNLALPSYISIVTMTLNGNTNLTVTNNSVGPSLALFSIAQNASGNATFGWPAGTVNAMNVNSVVGQTPNTVSYQIFSWTGILTAYGPGLFNP